MKKIITIGGGNGHSSILKMIYDYQKENNLFDNFCVTGIVSMSDDGRTTGLLMREMQQKIDLHMPPPGDLRRCLFSLSDSKYRKNFEELFEKVFEIDKNISEFSIKNMLEILGENSEIINYFYEFDSEFLDYKIPLESTIEGHKFGNILMSVLYYNFGDYNVMIDFMSELLDIKGKILPVTTNKATIYAELEDGTIIKTQDKISNVCDYNAKIKYIDLLEDSKNAKLNTKILDEINEADCIIICPGDLFTSLDSNFIIPEFSQIINSSNAKKIYILNSCNKTGETTDYSELDFLNHIQKRLENKLDYLFGASKIPELSTTEKQIFQNDISVKGGEYLFLDQEKINNIQKKYTKLKIISGDYLESKKLYKYNNKIINDLFELLKK